MKNAVSPEDAGRRMAGDLIGLHRQGKDGRVVVRLPNYTWFLCFAGTEAEAEVEHAKLVDELAKTLGDFLAKHEDLEAMNGPREQEQSA